MFVSHEFSGAIQNEESGIRAERTTKVRAECPAGHSAELWLHQQGDNHHRAVAISTLVGFDLRRAIIVNLVCLMFTHLAGASRRVYAARKQQKTTNETTYYHHAHWMFGGHSRLDPHAPRTPRHRTRADRDVSSLVLGTCRGEFLVHTQASAEACFIPHRVRPPAWRSSTPRL
jgi:hypothetical protein